jgi:hypothetical protein
MLMMKSVTAGKYTFGEDQLNVLANKSTEVSFEKMFPAGESSLTGSFAVNDQDKVGYLLRCWFCGGIALHRYYMGTTEGFMWALYCCVPVVGGVAQLVDFFWVIFEDDALSKYKNNNKYLVWLD